MDSQPAPAASEEKKKKIKPGHMQANWIIAISLYEEIKEYQHIHRLPSISAAARHLLEAGLKAGEEEKVS